MEKFINADKKRQLSKSYPTAQKKKFSIKYFFSKCDKIRSFLQNWSHLLNKSLMENLIFCAVSLAFWSLGIAAKFYFLILSKFNPLSVNPTKWSNTLKQFVGILPTNCLSVFDYFVGLALKRISKLTNSYFLWNHQKTIGYLMILGRIEVD